MSREAMKLGLEALKKCHYFMIDAGLPNQSLLIEAFKACSALEEELAKPDFWEGYVPEPDSTCSNALRIQHKPYPRTCKKCGLGPCVELAQQALDKKAENARELGLDYEPAQQKPVAWQPLPCPFCGHIGLDFADGETYRWGVASCGGCGASCGDVRREYPDKGEWHTEAIAEWNKRSPAAQRTWVGLTAKDWNVIGFTAEFRAGAEWAHDKLKEKNNG